MNMDLINAKTFAQNFRQQHQLSLPIDMAKINLKVKTTPMDKKQWGLYSDDVIVVNSNHNVRQINFTLAVAVGLRLQNANDLVMGDFINEPLLHFAKQFAYELLMPRDDVIANKHLSKGQMGKLFNLPALMAGDRQRQLGID